jgi:hypothetical protein
MGSNIWGLALLAMFVLVVATKGELPTYIGFLIPQGSATQPPAQVPPLLNPTSPVAQGVIPYGMEPAQVVPTVPLFPNIP